MLLDRIDIDAHGPLTRVELGPLAEHLNVVCGPEGSGKTAIARFIRDSLVSRDYPLGMLSSSTGRIVWADRNGLVHCRREQDGTAAGRRTVEFESRGDFDRHFGSLAGSWLSGVASPSDRGRVARSLQLPESIVDGVITDTAVTSVARVVSACAGSGLDCHETYRALPLGDDSTHQARDGYMDATDDGGPRRYDRNRRLREQLADVESELAKIGELELDHQALVTRRNSLAARVTRSSESTQHATTARSASPPVDRSRPAQWQQRLTELHDRARRLRARQSELRRWISEIDSDITHSKALYETRPPSADYQHQAASSDENLRRQLDDLDAQMIRWRRALLEVRGVRAALLSSQGSDATHPLSPLDESSLRRLRLDGFLHAIDRYDCSHGWDEMYPEAYRPLHRIDDIDHRIDSATRQIDWLLERYAGPDKPQSAWYQTLPESTSFQQATTLGDALRAIREDLRQVQRYTCQAPSHSSYRTTSELEELRRSERWLVEAVEQLSRHRESLLGSHATTSDAEVSSWSRDQYHQRYVLDRERNTSITELNQTTTELNACLREAADVRRSMRSLPVMDSDWYQDSCRHDWLDRDAIVAELRRIDDRLASSSRGRWLRARRSELLQQLQVVRQAVDTQSPLADAASRWLVRLSAGRLQRIAWPTNLFRENSDSYHRDTYHRTGVTINGRDENECPATDRAIAVMAVRMAAGDLLAQTGRQVPLVFETHREMFGNLEVCGDDESAPLAYFDHGHHCHSNHPIAAALRDYSRSGRQVVVLTSNQDLTAQLARVGARTFQIHAERVVHAHRPLWRPHYEAEHYAGPHPHTYGLQDADQLLGYDLPPADWRQVHRSAPVVDINRDFDMAWREAHGFYDNPDRAASASQRTDWARDGVDYRDGYYFADAFTTVAPQRSYRHDPEGHGVSQPSGATTASVAASRPPAPGRQRTAQPALRVQTPPSPFYLSVDSPIDQAPSIDAVAAARLRGLKVTHVNHLMQQDSNRLADALGLTSVDAATIRRWKSECRLVCRVPQLRGFDARVLVGCGVTTPAQLASIHPVDLLHEVEAFLATERGQRILLSGSSHELSRITSWIAAANSSPDHDFVPLGGTRNGAGRDPRHRHPSYYNGFNHDQDSEYAFDSDRYEYEEGEDQVTDGGDPARRRRRRRITATMNQREAAQSNDRVRRSHDIDNDATQRNSSSRSTGRSSGRRPSGTRISGTGKRSGRTHRSSSNGYGTSRDPRSDRRDGDRRGSGRRRRRGNRTINQSETPRRSVVQYDPETDAGDVSDGRGQREPREYQQRQPRAAREQPESETGTELRFFLHRDSPVVDAPSIGSRMAQRLGTVGIDTVDDLLNADPETVASELGHRRTDADTILQWQQQAVLVCRVPMLRGHDAQLLVAAEVTTPEELAESDAEELFGIIDPIARSSEGKRIIRGGKSPDLEEVTDWISYAQHHRELRAA